MKRIAIVSAMREELRTLLPELGSETHTRIAGRHFHAGRLAGHDAVLVLCGIGKVAAATTTAGSAS